jgi:hypothetical protein
MVLDVCMYTQPQRINRLEDLVLRRSGITVHII